ncbi:MAG: threonine--tRNA ligase [Polyangiales bacterium]
MSQLDSEHDHRDVAKRLDLLHFQEEAPGMVFWHERGFQLYRLLEDAVRQQLKLHGYGELRTPQLLRRAVWEASGHWSHFHEHMFRVDDESCEAALKPVSCPGHIAVYKQRLVSYRDLPLRMAELGLVHRDERGGSLHGLMRLRQFTQDDGHIFCSLDQVQAELLRFCRSLPAFYRAFGFDQFSVALSTRPASRAGDEADWDRAEAELSAACSQLGVPYVVQPGEGAFYGPKLEYVLRDRHGRSWQCGTIQVDLVLPKRFDLHYIDAAGARRHPVMLHRALFGSLERFLGILLEQHGVALPHWLAPVQAHVLPIAPDQHGAARELASALERAGVRVATVYEESLARRIAEAHEQGVPFSLVIGAREVASGAVNVRSRAGQHQWSVSQALHELVQLCAAPAFSGRDGNDVSSASTAA